MAECLLGIIEDKVQQIQSNHPELVDPEQLQDAIKQLFSLVSNINQLSMVIDLAVEGERVAAGLEYEDLHKAVAALKRRGFGMVFGQGKEFI